MLNVGQFIDESMPEPAEASALRRAASSAQPSPSDGPRNLVEICSQVCQDPLLSMSENSKPQSPASTTGPSISSSRLDQINVGDVIADKYRIAEVLGRGGMGLVVAAEHIQLQERVALKFLRMDTDSAREFQQRFVREAQMTAKLRGEHVARIRDFGMLEDGTPYMVMEFLEGTDLLKLIRHVGKLPIDSALDYLVQTCEGVAEAHAAGIVHRDLKPSNLFLTKRPDGSDLIKILDFGIAKMVQDSDRDELTEAGTLLGSPRYMSPEQLRSSEHLDARTDIWSIGAIIYELLVGHPPFIAHSTPALCVKIMGNEPPAPIVAERSDVSQELQAVILACLERDVSKRIPDVAALASRLAEAVKLPWIEPAAKRVAAVLERRGTQQPNTSSTISSSQVRSGLMVSMSQAAAEHSSDGCSHSAKTEVAWTQSGQVRSRKRTWAAVAIAAVVLVAAAGLFAMFRDSAGKSHVASNSPSATANTSSSAASPTDAPSAAASFAPAASQPPPTLGADANADAGKKATSAAWPVGSGKGPAISSKQPAATATQATSQPTSTRPPVNPLDDRQ